jgi:hypothetical protein
LQCEPLDSFLTYPQKAARFDYSTARDWDAVGMQKEA